MRRIGLDFDNTIICYDDVFLSAAKERGLLPADFHGGKQLVRDAIRLLPHGEVAWQKLQGFVYGRGIGGAQAFEGLGSFLKRTQAEGDTLFVVSHKTEYGHFDPDRINLRVAALNWMKARGFFDASGYGVAVENVFFESTRDEKLRRIAATGCNVFIDDLEEVFADPNFPPGVERILFSDRPAVAAAVQFKVCANWPLIEEAVFA
ncbi:hypothetical protein [Methylocapsa sp. S129]|uniref:hypothetical protein n=1 Tax=Methylocapsa sp. S129 TaxID=1641869 RepID=UPI00131B44B8|nr:hypothetical protein [Methylocapsa sp. S129]